MKKAIICSMLLMMIFIIGCCLGSASADMYPVQVGEKACDFTATLLDGSSFRLSDYLGKVVFVNVWASWCGPCVNEIPDLQQLAEDYSDTLVVLGINCGEEEQSVRNFIGDNKLTYFHATDEKNILIDSVFPTQYIPYTVVIDPTGSVLYAESGSQSYETFKTWYEEAAANALPEITPDPTAVDTPAPVPIELLPYNDAIAKLGAISLTDRVSLNQIYQSFQAVGSRYFAPQYLYLTQALLQLSGNETVDFDGIEISLTILNSNSAFIQSYMSDQSLAYLPLDSLLIYVNARRLEADGKLEEAYQAYISNQILDSIDRAIDIQLQLIPSSDLPSLAAQNPIVFTDKIAEDTVRAITGIASDDIYPDDVREIEALEFSSPAFLENIGLVDLSFLEYFSGLKELSICNCDVTNITPLSKLEKLEKLELWNVAVTDISILESLENLETLRISSDVSDVSALQNLVNLKELTLNCMGLSDISPLRNLIQMESLALDFCAIDDYTPIQNMIRLTSLSISDDDFEDTDLLTHFDRLESLSLTSSNIYDLSFLHDRDELTFLWLDIDSVSDISTLKNLKNLEELLIFGQQVEDISPLANLTHLRRLHVAGTQLQDLSPLQGLTNLIELYIWGNEISDIGALQNMTNLTTLDLDDNPLTLEQVQELRKKLPSTSISF